MIKCVNLWTSAADKSAVRRFNVKQCLRNSGGLRTGSRRLYPRKFTKKYAMTITIREAIEADIPLLADIGRQTFYDAFKENNSSQENFKQYLTEAFSKQKVTDDYHTNTNLFLLAEHEKNEAVAFAKLRWD